MFRFQPPLRYACLSTALTLAFMSSPAAAADNTATTIANQAAAVVDRGADELNKAQTAFQQALGREMSRLNRRYEDVKKELEEEYVGISHDKEAATGKLFNRVRDLTKKKEEVENKLSSEYAKVNAEMTRNNVPERDERYTDAIAAIDQRKSMVDRAYDGSLATLQQLYQLANKRYNELEKIQTARETLEDRRHREERDILAQRLGYEAHQGRTDLTEEDRIGAQDKAEDLANMQRELEERYHNSLNALDEYKALVNRRLKEQEKYETAHLDITRGLADADIDSASRTEFVERLNELDRNKDLSERRYQNDLRFVEEKLALQNRNNREIARLNDLRREVEQGWTRSMADNRRQREAIESQLKQNPTAEQKTRLESSLADLKKGFDQGLASYESAVDNVGERRALMEQSMRDRLSYLKERNDIRRRMTDAPADGEKLEKYRSEIAKLEQKRIEADEQMRNRMTALYDQMPSDYRNNPWMSANPEARRDRLSMRMGRLSRELENRYQAGKAAYRNKVEQINAALAVPGVDAARRDQLQSQLRQAEDSGRRIDEQYAKAKQAIEDRGKLEERRVAARDAYSKKRLELWRQMNTATAANKPGVEQQLKALDNQWLAQERAYRTGEQPLASLLPSNPEQDAEKQNDADAAWSREMDVMRNDEANVSSTARGAANAERGEGVWQRVKEAVSDTYHDAVTYLTD